MVSIGLHSSIKWLEVNNKNIPLRRPLLHTIQFAANFLCFVEKCQLRGKSQRRIILQPRKGRIAVFYT